MKIVQFPNGQYAIRRFSICYASYLYKDLRADNAWWSRNEKWFKDCLTDNLQELEQILSYGKPIK